MRWSVTSRTMLAALLVAACGGNGNPVVHVLDAAAIEALPALQYQSGQLVCVADGHDDCPLNSAYANRLGDRTVAVWEPGRRVLLLHAGDSVPAALGGEDGDRNYGAVAAIAQAGNRSYQLVTVDGGWRTITVSTTGEVLATNPLATPEPMNSVGFVGNIPVMQKISSEQGDTAVLTVERLRAVKDTSGQVLLAHPLPWLRGSQGSTPQLFPLIAASASWTLSADGDLIWSPGDSLVVERRDPRGKVRWRLAGGVGLPVTEADLDARMKLIDSLFDAIPLVDEDRAIMRSSSADHHPAVSGLTATSTGGVYVSGTATSATDSVEIFRLAPDGTPDGKFTLPRTTRILLAEADSILVHQPTEGEPWELRWLRISEK